MNPIEKLKNRGIAPRAVLYARFSSDNQREESIEAQLRAMHEFCDRNGVAVTHEFCDRAKSATTDDRPQFLAMVAASKECEFDFVIVHKLDRFSRNRYDSAFYKRELKRNGVQVISVLEQMDDSPESIILESVLEGMSEYYSKNLAREVMKGMRETAMACKYTGGHIPFGFLVDQETHKFLENPDEADGVRMMFKLVAEGHGYNEVLDTLNKLGYRTRLGNSFSKVTLYDILRNEKYNGTFIYSRASSKTEFGHRNNHKSKPLDEQIRIPGGMPKIIDDETFQTVQKIMDSRKRNRIRKSKRTYLLSGFVFCGICGHRYCGDFMRSRGSTIGMYTCNYKKMHGNQECSNLGIQQAPLEELVLKKLEEVIFDESRIPDIVKEYKKIRSQESDKQNEQVKAIKRNLKNTEVKIENLVNVIASTGSAALANQLTLLEQEKEILQSQMTEMESNDEFLKFSEENIKKEFHKAQLLFRSGELPQLRQLLNLYLDRIIIHPDYVEIFINNIPDSLNPFKNDDENLASRKIKNFQFIAKTGEYAEYGKSYESLDIELELENSKPIKRQNIRKTQKNTRVSLTQNSSKSGGAESSRFLLCKSETLITRKRPEETKTLRKIPLCRILSDFPRYSSFCIGKEELQGPCNGQRHKNADRKVKKTD